MTNQPVLSGIRILEFSGVLVDFPAGNWGRSG